MNLAARYAGERRIEIARTPTVAPGPRDVQIHVAYTGICGTDLHILHGDMDARVSIPAVLGHEMSGRIASVGAAVDGWVPGDPVTVMPLKWCGTCPACLAGHTHVCQRLEFVGIDSTGAMQHTWTVPADLLVRLPDDLPLDLGALVEPTAVAVHDVARAAVRPDEKAIVVGGGPVGLLIAAVAREAGADVMVLEVDEFRRSVIDGSGLSAVDPLSTDAAALILDWTAGAGASVTFEVSGSQQGLDTALEVLGVRGRMILVGIHPTPKPVNLHRVFWRELTIVGARVYERADFERAVELVSSGSVPARALISHVEPLGSAASAFEALEHGVGTMKVLIDCGAE